MRIDDTWGEKALAIVKDLNANVLVTSLNKQYKYEECKQYDLIASCTTGTDHIDNRDVPLISLKGERDFLDNVYATAEHTWALIMSLIRKIPFAHNDVTQGNWNREAWQGTELHGKTLGIIGYGRIGQQVARFAEAFGMNIRFNDIGKDGALPMLLWNGTLYKATSLDKLLQNSDIITVHVPLNEETKGMFGIEQFRLMKPTAYFVNTSRSAIVDGSALYQALLNDVIAGSAIDVIESYDDETKLDLRYANECGLNLIITPHIGGNTAESREKTQIFIANKIKEYIERGG